MTVERLSVIVFAVALALTGATQLRLRAVPIGPGELLLLAWCCATIGVAATRRDVRIRRPALPLLGFWSVSLVILTVDLIVFQALGGPQSVSYHAMFAYVFCALVCVAFSLWGTPIRLSWLAIWLLAATVVPLTFLRAAAALGLPLGGIDPWYSIRFRGWSENPNQIAFQLAIVPFLALFCRRHGPTPGARRLATALLPLSVIVGVSAFSDALTVAWVGGAVVFVAANYLGEHWRSSTGSWREFGRYVVLPLALMIVAVLGGGELYDHLRTQALTVYEDGAQGSHRFVLWSNGIAATLSAPIFGLGPGSHSGMTGAFVGSEAHNSFIDWATNAGFTGLVAYLALLFAIARPIIRSGEASLVAAFASLIAMSCFHFTFRHPSYWVGLALVAGLAAARSAATRTVR